MRVLLGAGVLLAAQACMYRPAASPNRVTAISEINRWAQDRGLSPLDSYSAIPKATIELYRTNKAPKTNRRGFEIPLLQGEANVYLLGEPVKDPQSGFSFSYWPHELGQGFEMFELADALGSSSNLIVEINHSWATPNIRSPFRNPFTPDAKAYDIVATLKQCQEGLGGSHIAILHGTASFGFFQALMAEKTNEELQKLNLKGVVAIDALPLPYLANGVDLSQLNKHFTGPLFKGPSQRDLVSLFPHLLNQPNFSEWSDQYRYVWSRENGFTPYEALEITRTHDQLMRNLAIYQKNITQAHLDRLAQIPILWVFTAPKGFTLSDGTGNRVSRAILNSRGQANEKDQIIIKEGNSFFFVGNRKNARFLAQNIMDWANTLD